MQEDFLHYIWKHKKFEVSNLKTVSGDVIRIVSVGTHNQNTGPDFFNTQLSIGNYIWDDLVIYIGEICKELEVIQINSALVTDGSILHMIKKCKHLTALDLSGCVKFCGLAFQ